MSLNLNSNCRSSNSVLQAILNGFIAEYSYTTGGNCWYLAKDFDHASKGLGIPSKLHKWASPRYEPGFTNFVIGDMCTMYPNQFEPIGALTWAGWQAACGDGTGDRDGWGYHEFVESNGAIYDPSAGVKKSGTWGTYEDACFEKYSKFTSLLPPAFTWDNNQTGQSSGCEATGYHKSDDVWPSGAEDFSGPPHGY